MDENEVACLVERHKLMYKRGLQIRSYESRRDACLKKQRASRRALLQKGRSLVVAETTETMEVDGEKCARSASSDGCFPSSLKSSRQRKQDAKRRVFMEQLVEPEWLLKNPTDLFLDVSESGVASDISAFDVVPMCDDKSEAGIRSPSDALKPSPEEPGWFVLPRVEGKRCLVISSNGRTVSRDKNGIIIHQFDSPLPSGSQKLRSCGSQGMFCILDCTYNVDLNTYFVMDLLCWKGQSLYGCSASMRFYWAKERLEEVGIGSSPSPSPIWNHGFSLVPRLPCSRSNIEYILSNQFAFGFPLDGLLFVARGGYYEPDSQPSPLMLIWKHETCSRYFERAKTAQLPMVVKQNVHSVNSAKLWPFLVVNLTCTDDSNAVMSTREGYELLDIRSIAFEGEKKDSDSNFRFELNRLYRFVIYFETFSDRAGAAEVNDIRPFVGVYQGLGSKRRLYADIYSRIMFHVNPVDL